jgi:hypothetical protein
MATRKSHNIKNNGARESMTLIVPEGSVIEIKESITVFNAPEKQPEPVESLWTTE